MAINIRRVMGEISASHIHVGECLQMESGSRISGSLVPIVTDDPAHSLGDPNIPWKDAYLSSGSLFIDGIKTLHRESGSMKVDATASLASFTEAAPTTVTVHSGIVDQIVLDLFSTVKEIPDQLNTFRFLMDLSRLNQVRLVANITLTNAGAGSFVALQFSTDGETTWDYLGGSDQPQLPCTVDGSVKSGSWANITGSAKQEAVIRIVGQDPTKNGPGSNTVEVGTFLLQFR